MDSLMLFTDGSVDTLSKIGYGACLVVRENEDLSNGLNTKVNVKRFVETSSTKLELQTLLWALSEIQVLNKKITVYTDSQNIMGLPGRRDRFEKNDYRSKSHKLLNNHELYRRFFEVIDQMNCDFVKVQGHLKSNHKNEIDQLFTRVDRASRNALRSDDTMLE